MGFVKKVKKNCSKVSRIGSLCDIQFTSFSKYPSHGDNYNVISFCSIVSQESSLFSPKQLESKVLKITHRGSCYILLVEQCHDPFHVIPGISPTPLTVIFVSEAIMVPADYSEWRNVSLKKKKTRRCCSVRCLKVPMHMFTFFYWVRITRMYISIHDVIHRDLSTFVR